MVRFLRLRHDRPRLAMRKYAILSDKARVNTRLQPEGHRRREEIPDNGITQVLRPDEDRSEGVYSRLLGLDSTNLFDNGFRLMSQFGIKTLILTHGLRSCHVFHGHAVSGFFQSVTGWLSTLCASWSHNDALINIDSDEQDFDIHRLRLLPADGTDVVLCGFINKPHWKN